MDESEVRVRGFVGDVSAGGRCLPSPRTDLLEPPSCASSVIAPRARQTDRPNPTPRRPPLRSTHDSSRPITLATRETRRTVDVTSVCATVFTRAIVITSHCHRVNQTESVYSTHVCEWQQHATWTLSAQSKYHSGGVRVTDTYIIYDLALAHDTEYASNE